MSPSRSRSSCYLAGDTESSRGRNRTVRSAARHRETLAFGRVFADSSLCDSRSCNWHVPCSIAKSDTGTAEGKVLNDQSLRAGSSRGKKIRTRATDEQSGTSIGSASRPRTLGQVSGIGFFRVTRSPGGSCPVPSCVGSRERGESNSSQPKLSSPCGCSTSSQFVTKNQIRPVNEAGRAVGFIPVTPCSLGKRQPEGWSDPAGSAAFSIFPASFALDLDTHDERNLDCALEANRSFPSSAGVAQLVEHLICNEVVGGSSPFASSAARWPVRPTPRGPKSTWRGARAAKGSRL